MSRPFVVAQISDLHVKQAGRLSYRVVDTGAMTRACVDALLALKQRPDIVVATGDLTDFGRPEEYAALRELLAPLCMPLYLLPGNHDDRDGLRRAFPEHLYLRQSPDFVQYAIEEHPLRLVAIDTLIPGEAGGELCSERLAWLDAMLVAQPVMPTLVLMHHPPFATLIGHMDQIGLKGCEGLAQVIGRHAQVERILCGHLHRPIQARFAGTIASTAPSPAHQVALDLVRDAPSQFVMEPPAFQLHVFVAGAGVVSHTAYIGRFQGPYPFHHDGKLID
jgi:3',5'-cyclic-AMP phosphodiesterase